MNIPDPLMDHLGDGVYAIDRGDGLMLHANHHLYPTDRIFLEPSVLDALNSFAKRCEQQRERPAPPEVQVIQVDPSQILAAAELQSRPEKGDSFHG